MNTYGTNQILENPDVDEESLAPHLVNEWILLEVMEYEL